MLSGWPNDRWYRERGEGPSGAARMLTHLARLGDVERLDAFLADIAPSGLQDKRDNEAILIALDRLPADRSVALVERILAGAATASLTACGDLLARVVAARPLQRPALARAATILIDALPGDPARAAPRAPWEGPAARIETGFIVDLLTALVHVGENPAKRAAHYMLAWPKTYGVDHVLIPAVRRLITSSELKELAAVQQLRAACLDHLRGRLADPLEPPKDWRRDSALSCHCVRCAELGRYLADPGRPTWVFKAAEFDRRHVEDVIRKARCDLDVRTDRRGRPFSLVCTKNHASYERRVKQRKSDLENLAALNPN